MCYIVMVLWFTGDMYVLNLLKTMLLKIDVNKYDNLINEYLCNAESFGQCVSEHIMQSFMKQLEKGKPRTNEHIHSLILKV